LGINKAELIKQSLFKALQVRNEQSIDFWTPLCVYDLVEKYDIEVIFSPINSLEGMYSKKDSNVILISSLRPSGRQVFTCAHEFGHFLFNHKFKIDELNSTNNYYEIKEELLADAFAGFLLMPKIAIQKAFKDRAWNIEKATAKEFYIVSKVFGVGYSSLLNHMRNSLKLITYKHFVELKKITPKKIRENIFGLDISSELFICDEKWNGRPVDIQIGDIIMTSENISSNGKNLKYLGQQNKFHLFEGIKPGIDRFESSKSHWTSFVRISRREYEGRSMYRHLEEVEDE